ncbi:hypothetical protein MKW98_015343 [Papaver atlanticum]|uniref:BED-type domain-containing protein n=1 Tax=Papaver atlanticum TaxID=357466 RepID=A0AAD4XQZ0_9MAGN|nr:hypothetical protein MKW98_015343 [Papaver atlanticum]
MSEKPPSQAASKSVQRRASTVASPPPPPPPSSQPGISGSKKRKRTSWVWKHFVTSFDADGNEWAKCNYCEAGSGRYRVGGKDYGTTNLNYHLTKCNKYKDTLESGSSGQHSLDFQPIMEDEQQIVGVTFFKKLVEEH